MDHNSPKERKSWYQLAAQASTEQDDRRLLALVEELCQALDRERPQTFSSTEDCV